MTTTPLITEAEVDASPAGPDNLLRALTVTGVATAGSGVGLMVAPRLALWALGAKRAEPAPYLFRIVGMFMTVSGGSLVDLARAQSPAPETIRWAMTAKLGAAAAVTGAVLTRRFGKQAWTLVVTDAVAAGALCALLQRTTPRPG